jgi:hypothetical protein
MTVESSLGPLVSVIMPTFNQADFLRDAIESVRRQTYSNWELIIIDNYSTDLTPDVIASFGDPRIHHQKIKNNGVIAVSRNAGVALAKGEYLAFLDSDDWWFENKLVEVMSRIKNLAVISHGMRIIRTDSEWATVSKNIPKVTFERLLCEGNCVSTSTVVMTRNSFNFVGGFDENPTCRTAEDYDLWIRIAKNGLGVRVLPDVLAGYRIHNANSSGRFEVSKAANLFVLDKHCQDLPGAELQNRARLMTEYRLGLTEASIFLRNQERLAATRVFGKLIVSRPVGWRAWLGLISMLLPGQVRWSALKVARSFRRSR